MDRKTRLHSLLEPKIVQRAVFESFVKLNPSSRFPFSAFTLPAKEVR